MPEDPKQNRRQWWKNPVLRDALFATAGAGAGYVGSGLLSEMLVNVLFAARPTHERQQLAYDMRNNKLLRGIGTTIGATAGAALSATPRMDFTQGLSGMQDSYLQGDYWHRNPDRLAERIKAVKGQPSFMDNILLQKKSTYQSPFTTRSIPVLKSLSTIQNEPGLSSWERQQTSSLIAAANHNMPGTVSPAGLARTAFRAGAGFVPAYLFGKVTGSLLGLPEPVTSRMSTIGGIAGAIKASGIFK